MDRPHLIRTAFALPKGDEKRRTILADLAREKEAAAQVLAVAAIAALLATPPGRKAAAKMLRVPASLKRAVKKAGKSLGPIALEKSDMEDSSKQAVEALGNLVGDLSDTVVRPLNALAEMLEGMDDKQVRSFFKVLLLA
jgi:hypothetical protein